MEHIFSRLPRRALPADEESDRLLEDDSHQLSHVGAQEQTFKVYCSEEVLTPRLRPSIQSRRLHLTVIGSFLLLILALVIFTNAAPPDYQEVLSSLPDSIKSLPDLEQKGDVVGSPSWLNKIDNHNKEAVERATEENMKARRACLETQTCKPNQDKIVLLVDHSHHKAIVEQDHAGGELIWARSSMKALRELNYTLVWHSAKYTSQLNDIVWEKYGGYDSIHMAIAEAGRIVKCSEDDTCFYSKDKNPRGLPLWKFLSFHFFADSMHPLGGDWVLSPEPYTWVGSRNQYLGYSIEEQCMKTAYLEPEARHGSRTKIMAISKASKKGFFNWIGSHVWTSPDLSLAKSLQSPIEDSRKVAWVLAKRLSYMQTQPGSGRKAEDTPWHQEQFDAAYNQLNVRFELGARNDSNTGFAVPDWTNDPARYQNHNLIYAPLFHQVLSANSVVIGVGRPPISPTPYDSLCLGVPFINPVLSWNKHDPSNRTFWQTQHDGLKDLQPPYVYHVLKNDTQEFVRAIGSALGNPIKRFVLPRMHQSLITERMERILSRDHKAMAVQLIEQRRTSRKGVVYEID